MRLRASALFGEMSGAVSRMVSTSERCIFAVLPSQAGGSALAWSSTSPQIEVDVAVQHDDLADENDVVPVRRGPIDDRLGGIPDQLHQVSIAFRFDRRG